MRLVNRLILSVITTSILLGCYSGNGGQVVESHKPCKPYSRIDVLTSPGEWRLGKSDYTQVGVKLNDSVSIKLPSRQWMHYISPHGYPEYSRESCSYRGDIILGSTTLQDVDFNGIPLCAFYIIRRHISSPLDLSSFLQRKENWTEHYSIHIYIRSKKITSWGRLVIFG